MINTKRAGMAILAVLAVAGSSLAAMTSASAFINNGEHFVRHLEMRDLSGGRGIMPYLGYAYGGDCYVQRRVIINRFGRRAVHSVRVCD
jgi:hypothetical protein